MRERPPRHALSPTRLTPGRGSRGGGRGWAGWAPAVLAVACGLALGADTRPALPREYAVVVTGGELLEGAVSDAHTAFLARTLLPLGLRCVQSTVVDDTAEDLRAALASASQRAALVLITGGLGPTVNDITREVLSEHTGVPLREDPAILAELSRRFGQPVADLRENLRRQARVPAGGDYLPNDRGTAVGLIFESDPTTWIALPGPPRELRPMVLEVLVPWLRQRLGLPDQGRAITLRFVGLGQSAIDAVLRGDGLLPAGAVVTSQFEGSRVDFTFAYPRDTAEARAALDRLAAGITERLGQYLYSTQGQSLEDVVLDRLRALRHTLALAEVRRPHLAASLSGSSRARGVLAGSYLAMTGEDLRRLLGVPDEVWTVEQAPQDEAKILAEAARTLAGASLALAISGPAADAKGEATVWVAFVGAGRRPEVWPLRVRESPESGWTSPANEVLDRLRRAVLEPSAAPAD